MRPSRQPDDKEDEWESDSESEFYDDDSDVYIRCPFCGEMMLEAAEHCPSCDRWITSETAPPRRHPWWIIAIVLLLIAIMLFSAFGF